MEKMIEKKTGAVVEVYKFFENSNTALIYSPDMAGHTNGQNGWKRVKLGSLVPIDYYKEHYINDEFVSQTKLNKIARNIKLHYAEWQTSDGELYTDKNEAIRHETLLALKEEDC